jgi:hypothetical protein
MVQVAGFSPASSRLEDGCLITSSHTRKMVEPPRVPLGSQLSQSCVLCSCTTVRKWSGGRALPPVPQRHKLILC